MHFHARFVTNLLFCTNVLHISSEGNPQQKHGPFEPERRQDGYFAPSTDPNVKFPGAGEKITLNPDQSQEGEQEKQSGAGSVAQRFTTKTTTTTVRRRSTPGRVSLEEECDYLAYYCLKAYKTGRVCGRTLYYNYQDFKNYCMLDYVNCMERYEVWQIVHMGECFNVTVLSDYQHYEYHDDTFLDQTYVIQE